MPGHVVGRATGLGRALLVRIELARQQPTGQRLHGRIATRSARHIGAISRSMSRPANKALAGKVPGASHVPYVERPDLVWPAIEDFLQATR